MAFVITMHRGYCPDCDWYGVAHDRASDAYADVDSHECKRFGS